VAELSARAEVGGGAVSLVECLDEGFCDTLRSRGYLRGGAVDPLEAMLQAVRGRLEVSGARGWDAFLWIARDLGVPLKEAIVYLALRRRYPEVHRGPRASTLVARGRSGRPVEVLVLEEGESVSVGELARWSQLASGDGHEPVVAIVDRNGQATFYEARVVSQIL